MHLLGFRCFWLAREPAFRRRRWWLLGCSLLLGFRDDGGSGLFFRGGLFPLPEQERGKLREGRRLDGLLGLGFLGGRFFVGLVWWRLYRDDYTANCGACYQDKDGPPDPVTGAYPLNGGRAYCTVADTIGQICQNVPGCEPDPDHDPFKYRERLGPASPPQTLPQPLPQPLNRRNLRFGYKEDVFCPEGCKPKED